MEEKYPIKSTYHSIHKWVYKQGGKANMCELCKGKGSKYHWSNKSGLYLQDMSDWQQLCVKCHNSYDNIPAKVWEARRKSGKLNQDRKRDATGKYTK